MNILNNLSLYATYVVPCIKESILPTLTAQQKRIAMVASVAFGILATIYLISRCCLSNVKASPLEDSESDVKPLKKAAKDCINININDDEADVVLMDDVDPIEVIKALPQGIKSLVIQGSPKCSDDMIKELPPGLEKLFIFDCPNLTPATIALLPRGLKELDLQLTCNATDQDFDHLPPHLETLYVNAKQAKVSSHFINHLPVTLKNLTLNVNYISDDQAIHFPQLERLSLLKLHVDSGLTKFLPKTLLHLFMANCQVKDAALKDLPEGLIELDLAENPEVTDDGIDLLPKGLKSLSLKNCSLITEKGIKNLPPALEHLSLSLANALTESSLVHLPKRLKQVGFTNNPNLTDEGIKNLPEGLEVMTLMSCDQLTDAALKFLPKGLKKLVVVRCANISASAIENLKKERDLKILFARYIKKS